MKRLVPFLEKNRIFPPLGKKQIGEGGRNKWKGYAKYQKNWNLETK